MQSRIQPETQSKLFQKGPSPAVPPGIRDCISSSSAQRPDIYDFQDYREFLKTWFEWKKTIQPEYSGAVFSKMAGMNSHTLLGMVIRKKRNLSYQSIRNFTKAL